LAGMGNDLRRGTAIFHTVYVDTLRASCMFSHHPDLYIIPECSALMSVSSSIDANRSCILCGSISLHECVHQCLHLIHAGALFMHLVHNCASFRYIFVCIFCKSLLLAHCSSTLVHGCRYIMIIISCLFLYAHLNTSVAHVPML